MVFQLKIIQFLFFSLICIFLGSTLSSISYGASGNWPTHLNSSSRSYKKSKRQQNPAFEVPSYGSKWKLAATINGQINGEARGAPAYSYSVLGGWGFIGFVPAETPIELKHMESRAKIHYYSMTKPASFIPRDGGKNQKKKKPSSKSKGTEMVWIPGSYIVPQ